MELSIRAWMDGPYTVVKIEGEVSNSTAHNLKLRLTDLMDYKRRRFIVDLSEVQWTDFTGIAALVMAAYKNQELGGTFRLVAKPGPSLDYLEKTGFANHYPVYESVAEAKTVAISSKVRRSFFGTSPSR